MMKIGKSILLYKKVLGYMMEASPVYCVLRLVFVILQRISFVLLLQFSILWVTNLIESGHNFYNNRSKNVITTENKNTPITIRTTS